MNEPVLELKNLTVEFPTRRGLVRAVNQVSLTLEKGQRLGLVGESGSGKSMTLLSILRLVPHPGLIAQGGITYQGTELLGLKPGEMRALRGKDIAMIFQDPMTTLNPVYKVGDQIRESLRVHNVFTANSSLFVFEKKRRAAERRRVLELMDEVGIPSAEERYEAFPHEFSGGMQQRAVIAIALACNPNILLADEPTTALDVTVQAQIMALLERINQERGTAIILVTHDLSLASEFCDRIAVMYAGRILEQGSVADVIDRPRHPYTIGLLNALPRMRFGRRPLQPIPGEVDLASLPLGCVFANRCSQAEDMCYRSSPQLEVVEPGHEACCFKCREITSYETTA
ncbi:MAG: ABC transporter ATP-binding protein [Deltaproteobacteria bacterium]|nr:ABC transporter ATP-binding protein [Deltaproteobacteria bacterium]MBW2017679.1 ABC transporter ATP-binding protein [Deltaproteobacteria bacterium]MBW2130161.1 ABC transporter ATP-binding protein [Deltaproteobacteria bacterium]MBW2304946.1 ABC transporter ATP-binding protein [Deltaproteobacteria bacterium]